MEISELKSHFQVIIAREDIRFPKPDPEIYFTAAQKSASPLYLLRHRRQPSRHPAAKMAV